MEYSNKEIAQTFALLGRLLELHGESSFKTKAYENAYRVIRGLSTSVIDLSKEDLLAISGIGNAIADKIIELKNTGEISALSKVRSKTPAGVIDILNIKGLGAKKVQQIWQQLGIESVGELLYACNENRLVSLNGFGAKTQKDIAEKAQFFLDSMGAVHFAKAISLVEYFEDKFKAAFPDSRLERAGAIRRELPTVEFLEFLGNVHIIDVEKLLKDFNALIQDEYVIGDIQGVKFKYYFSHDTAFGSNLFLHSTPPGFQDHFVLKDQVLVEFDDEIKLFESLGINFVIPQRREAELLKYPNILYDHSVLSNQDIRGVIHAHSTFSDGSASMKEMGEACRVLGYEYLLMTDHSKAAFYANGLSELEVKRQWDEIDRLNSEWDDFRIFKGIECDILSDGRLDYDADILSGFECVIASIHSVLKMDIQKATDRLIKAIENPYTKILGHPTGRLLLSRAGYPIDHQKVIDAAAANRVVIEINANPYRLDLDWTWIPYALEKGVTLSINPDAHSIEGIKDIRWGIPVAVKGGASAHNLLCCMNRNEFNVFVTQTR